MYIDFRDPEKNSFDSSFDVEETPKIEPVKKTGFDKFRRKKSKKKSQEEIPKEIVIPKEELSLKPEVEDTPLENSKEESLDILQKINQVIAEQNGTTAESVHNSVDKKILYRGKREKTQILMQILQQKSTE